MRVLIACEFSGTVRDAFAAKGHDAWSCDLLPCERGGQHLQRDVMEVLNNHEYDLAILHPPCTKIALCGNKHYGRGCWRHDERVEAMNWTADLWHKAKARCKRVMMENPKNIMGKIIGKKTQTIHPWQFGHMEQKETWLWLHNLPPLKPTNDVYDEMMKLPKSKRERIFHMTPSATRGQDRSRTFQGWANAMADQWGNLPATP